MPRDRSTSLAVAPAAADPTAPAIPSRALLASATRYQGKTETVYKAPEQWQREAYRHYRICGEARYAARFMGHAMSRAVLSIARETPEGDLPVLEGQAVELLKALFAGKDGQAQMLEAIGVHLTIAGECWLVGRESYFDPDDPTLPFADGQAHDIWEIVSIIEMGHAGNTWSIKHEGYAPINLNENAVKIRIWIPDPAERTKADSPFRSMLPVLREIEYLTMHIFAQTSSRLLGAGLMFIDQDIDFPPPVDAQGKPIAYVNQAQGFMLSLAQVMEKAYANPGGPESRVPFIAAISSEAMKGDPAKLLKFWTELDDKARDLRNDSIHRFALGLDMAPEQLLGMSSNPGTGGGSSNGVSHWGAWQVEESTIKMAVEPMLEVVVNCISVGYLRPLMLDEKDNSVLDGEKVTYDTSKLRLRPDRSKESLELNKLGLLKDEVTVLENGFKKTDMMDKDDQKWWLLRKLVGASPAPEQLAAAAKLLVAIDLPSGSDQTPRGDQPTPSLEDHPERPRTPAAAALLPAAELVVYRALERAGSRIRASHKNITVAAEPYEIHTKLAANGSANRAMEGAWSCAEKVLSGIEGVNVEDTLTQLNTYCLNLLTTQQPHSRERLAEFLEV